ncbi:MAG: glycosyltransferase family 4 protein [Gammaproteobacteria bacterium]
MKIMHTEWSLGWGGQEIRIVAEMQAMKERGHEMMLAARAESRIIQEAAKKGFETHVIDFGLVINPLTIGRLASLLKRTRADIVHTHSSKDGWIGGFAGRLAGIPVIRSRHLSSPIKRKPSNVLVYRKLPDAIIASGRHIVEHMVNDIGCDPAKMVSVPAGADHHRFLPSQEHRQAIRAELGLTEQDLVVGMVAVLRSWKGHHLLMEALREPMQANPNIHLLIAGDGPRREYLHNLMAEIGTEKQTHFLGHRPDVERLYPAFDVNVLPSIKNEATSQVIPQGMLCEVASVVSDAGGLTEIIQDGVNGLVVPADDVPSLREAVTRLLEDSEMRARFATVGREDALQRLTFEGQIDVTEGVYLRLGGRS